MLYAQATKIINLLINKGLPTNLAVNKPSLSFLFKGVDISIASYMLELALLANPVSNYVQSVEMYN